MKRKLIPIVVALLALAMIFSLCGCSGDKTSFTAQSSSTSDSAKDDSTVETTSAISDSNKTTQETQEAENMTNPQVKVKMENGGEFTIELYPEYAPKTVANFLKLVNEGFYDGLTFHRVVDNFMAQGGDPDGTGMGGSDETIYGEFPANGWTQNTLSHTRGVISMARSAVNDSASSQFFICYSDYCNALDGDYAAFGKVIDGMEVVDGFCDVERKSNSMGEKASPVTPIVIESMTEIK